MPQPISIRAIPNQFLLASIVLLSPIPIQKATSQQPAATPAKSQDQIPPTGLFAPDREKLQGKWQIVSLGLGGKTLQKDDSPSQWKETFARPVKISAQFLGQGDGPPTGSFQLDETHDPKQITIKDMEGKLTYRGIYTLKDDSFKVCINGNGSDPKRPENFTTREDSAFVIIELKKAPLKK